jgi:hypothetical protein
MSNDEKFDLSGVFHVQQNYLTDLSNSYPNVNSAPLIARYVLDLQNKIDDVTQSYQKADTSAKNILTEQNDMIDIVKTEQDRIQKKKENIDQAVMEQKRKALLTESNRLRNAEYTKIILIIILCIVIHILLIAAYKYFFEEPVPNSVFTFFAIAHLTNFAIWTIIAFYMFVNIQTRSQINFNELDLPPPTALSSGSTTPAVADYNNLFKDLGLCYGQSCCGPNTIWSKDNGHCIDDNNSNQDSKSATPALEPITPKDIILDPETTNSPGTNVEGFESYNSLNTLPQFYSGAKTMTPEVIPKEPEYDPLTATEDEVREKTRNDIKKLMGNAFMNNAFANGDIPQLDFDDITNNVTNSLPNDEILGEEETFGVKCGFTTMENSGISNPIYNPTFSNPLLPSKA